jgi:predicted NACHT family NTPase
MATPRSLKLSPDGQQDVQLALTNKAWRDADLAEAIEVTEQTAEKFRLGRKVDRKNFVKFCQALGLDWATVAEPESPPAPNSRGTEPVEKARSTTAENLQQNSDEAQGIQVQGSETTIVGQTVNVYQTSQSKKRSTTGNVSATSKIDGKFIQRVKENCHKKILNQCGEIRLLSGDRIGVDRLYVDVWLLDRQPSTFQVSQDKMLQTFDLRNDRLGLGDRIQRNPGFDVANKESRLLILGKPGSGKTTFLKHLAVDWCHGKFLPDLITVFIEFRQIRNKDWKLIDTIVKELGTQKQKESEDLLKRGKLMILMDGFDEVPTGQLRRNVQAQLQSLVEAYPGNRFILTCRTQIIESIPDQFKAVEVADFNDEQVLNFVHNWFEANDRDPAYISDQWDKFSQSITTNLALKELTVTPVLLGLMCLILQDEGEIPIAASSLYERGIKLLLRKWNDSKIIDGWEIGTDAYRKLDVEEKEKLLVQIAAKKFENPKNFVLFEEEDLCRQVAQELGLPRKSDGRVVLKSIEAQHGLLIERADELWSFSHLTFQEHFTMKWLLGLPSEQLSQKISDPRWQNVVEQLVKSQGKSDRLLKIIKQAIAHSIVDDQKVQEFLNWVQIKSDHSHSLYNSSAIRAFYFSLALELNRALELSCARAKNQPLDTDLARTLDNTRAVNLQSALALALERTLDPSRNLDLSLATAIDNHALQFVHCLEPNLASKLEQLRDRLPHWRKLEKWWQNEGQDWVKDLYQINNDHGIVDANWRFSVAQMKKIRRYYDANNFLMTLLRIPNAVSPEVRQEIEDNLLLPIAELKRRLPDQYGGIEN